MVKNGGKELDGRRGTEVTWEMVKRELRGDEGKCKYAHSDPVRCLPVSASWAGIYPNGGSIPCT